MEYWSIVWHDNLTQAQGHSIERLQIVALKLILGADSPRRDDGHFDYYRALVICNFLIGGRNKLNFLLKNI